MVKANHYLFCPNNFINNQQSQRTLTRLTCDAMTNATSAQRRIVRFKFRLHRGKLSDLSLTYRKMSASKKYKCSYCPQRLPTLKGIRLHVSQRYACRQASIRRAASKKQTLEDESSEPGDPGDDLVQPLDETRMMETEETMIFDQGLPADSDAQSPNPDQPSSSSRRAQVEEVEDEEAGGSPKWVEDYPGDAGKTKSRGQSYFKCWREAQKENGYEPWAPFKDMEEWELSQWIMQSGLTQNATDKYLKLPIVSLIAVRVQA